MAASIRNSTLRNVIIGVIPAPPPPPAVVLNAFGYFQVTNFQPEPGPYPTFSSYPALPDSSFLNGGPTLQSDDPGGAVGYLTVTGFNGDYSLGAGTGVSINIQPMSVGTTRTFVNNDAGNIVSTRYTFPMLMTDNVFIVARTGSGDNGFGFYTAGSLTIVVGPSVSAGERYLITWVEETFLAPSSTSLERLTDIGPRP